LYVGKFDGPINRYFKPTPPIASPSIAPTAPPLSSSSTANQPSKVARGNPFPPLDEVEEPVVHCDDNFFRRVARFENSYRYHEIRDVRRQPPYGLGIIYIIRYEGNDASVLASNMRNFGTENPCYGGQTYNNPGGTSGRWWDHTLSAGCRLIHEALNEFGFDNFSFNIVESGILIADLNDKEKYWIDVFKSHKFNGLQSGFNQNHGGGGRGPGTTRQQSMLL